MSTDDLGKAINQAVATGKMCVDYDPLNCLRELFAAVSFCDGYKIDLGKDHNAYLYRRLSDTVLFNSGSDRPRVK